MVLQYQNMKCFSNYWRTFVLETVSVIIQVIFLNSLKKNFKMAPIHHHLKKGWAESLLSFVFGL